MGKEIKKKVRHEAQREFWLMLRRSAVVTWLGNFPLTQTAPIRIAASVFNILEVEEPFV